MSFKYLGALLLAVLSPFCLAEDGKAQARTFDDIYRSLCLKNINNLNKLKEQLALSPQMSPEQTRQILRGAKGFAWRIPSDEGAFILSLQDKPPTCTVMAHHADAKTLEELFLKLVNAPIAPLESKKISSREDKTKANGTAHTLTYEWQAKQGKHKLVFVLSTSSYEKADLQAFGSISLVTEQ